jgi:type IV pilus assembly protein PilM
MLGSERILALDIGAATIKLAEFQASKTHGLRLTNFNHADLGLDPDQDANRKAQIVATLRGVIRERGLRTRKVIFTVSGQSVFTRFVKLPPVDESKVVQIIQYEAQQNVPFPISEVIWDYQVLGSSPQGEVEVVLLAIKSDIIEDLNDAVETAGLHTDIVDVSPMALYNAFRYNYGDLAGCTMLVDIGARTTNLLFIEQGRVFSRAIPIAGNAITQSIAAEFNVPFRDAEQLKKAKGFVALGGAYEEPQDPQQSHITKIIRNVMTKLHAEVARSINFYRSQQGGGAPARLFLSGGTVVLPYTDRFFQEKVQVPVEYFNPFRNVEMGPQISREDLARCAHFFGEVVGAGLRRVTECPIEVNLLPHSVRDRQQAESQRPFLVGAAIGLLLIPACWLAYTSKVTALKQHQLQQVADQAQLMQDLSNKVLREKQELDKLRTQADLLVNLVQERSYWPSLLQDLNTRLVPGLVIVKLEPQSVEPAVAASRASGWMARPGPVIAPVTAANVARRITDLVIVGAGHHSTEDPGLDGKQVAEFAANLRQSPFFDPQGIEISRLPNLMLREQEFTFELRVKLKQPLSY